MTPEENNERKKIVRAKWRLANKEKIAKMNKNYRDKNKEILNEKARLYNLENKEKHKEKTKKFREENPEYIIKYREENKNRIKETRKKYNSNNKAKINKKKYEYCENRKKTDPLFKLSVVIRQSIRQNLKCNNFTKKSSSKDILGCSIEEFKKYLESKFESWMSWENRGNWNGTPTELNTAWDMDHIIPLSSATTEEGLLKLFHYTNIQPLCSYTNRFIKRDKLI